MCAAFLRSFVYHSALNMAASSHSQHQDQPTLRLNIVNTQELRHFLRVIHPEFLRVVDPRESGLLDILYAAQLITESDQESLSGKDVHTRKDQARKLFFLLNKIPLDEFLSKVSPVLIKEFPHIIPTNFLTQDEVDVTPSDAGGKCCLRHDIMGRVRAASMADLLYHHGCLELEDYEGIIALGKLETDIMWTKIFTSCQDYEQNSPSPLVQGLQALLTKYKVRVPENLTELVSRGVPCTCPGGGDSLSLLPPAPSPLFLNKVGSWVEKSPFDCHSPRSSSSSCTRVDLRSYSGATSVRDDDSQSLSSEDLVDPDPIMQALTILLKETPGVYKRAATRNASCSPTARAEASVLPVRAGRAGLNLNTRRLDRRRRL